MPILQNERGELYLDALLFGEDQLLVLFSFARAYFFVDMEVPAGYVSFLRWLMPKKPRAELYMAVGPRKQGKTLFYRDLHYHLKHSTDRFVVAPGIKGMVMLVFTLPSFPYVFKLIRDRFAPPKDIDRQTVKDKYLMVKLHDRVGRMADTLEYSLVALPLERFDPALVAELKRECGSIVEFDGDELVHRPRLHRAAHAAAQPARRGAAPRRRRASGCARRCASTATPSRSSPAPASSRATCCSRTSA